MLLSESCKCGGDKFNNIESFYTHQEIELPEIHMEITHFILHKGECADCGQTVKAALPVAPVIARMNMENLPDDF